MKGQSELRCRCCGAVLVSDGVNWVCPLRTDDEEKHTSIPDLRLTINKSVTVVRPAGVPSPLGRSRVRLRSKVHKGSQRSCFSCNPAGAERWRAHVKNLEAKGWRVSL